MKIFSCLLYVSLSISAYAFQDDELQNSLSFSYEDYRPSKFSNKTAVFKWNSQEGIDRLERSKYKGDFFRLAHHFRPQDNEYTSGLASFVTILRTMYEQQNKKMPLHKSIQYNIGGKNYYIEYRDITYDVFLNYKANKIKNIKVINGSLHNEITGMLEPDLKSNELVRIIETSGLDASFYEMKSCKENDIDSMRSQMKKYLNNYKAYLIGHFSHDFYSIPGKSYSPIAAYDEVSDSVLIINTENHKNSWYWVDLYELCLAMHTKDDNDTRYRGYIIISGDI